MSELYSFRDVKCLCFEFNLKTSLPSNNVHCTTYCVPTFVSDEVMQELANFRSLWFMCSLELCWGCCCGNETWLNAY